MKFYVSLILLKKSFIYAPLLFLASCVSTTQKPSALAEKTNSEVLKVPFAPLEKWSERKFVGSTQYQIISNPVNNSEILLAKSEQSASLLFQKIRIDLNATPYINWQWQVRPQLGQIKPRALTYVWASHAKQFTHWKNPYAKTVEVMALQSGDKFVGKWLKEKRNLKEDLSQLFGQEIDSIEGIGIMTDTDNSKISGEALLTSH